MMRWIETLVHRPALVTVIYMIIVMFGLFSYSKLPVDMLPDLEAPVVTVVTAYPGAAALDVEDKISQPLEEVLGSISNLKELSSTSRENISVVSLVFDGNTDINEATNDVRQSLERMNQIFPKGAERSMVLKFDFSQMPIVRFAITTKGKDIRELRDEIDDALVKPLSRVPGVGSVQLRNAPEKQVQILVHQEKLYRHGLTMAEVAQIIAASNIDIPAGDVSMGTMSFSLRLPGQAKSLDALRALPLLHSPLGQGVVRLADIADVRLELGESTEDALVNGENAMIGYLRKTSDANTVAVTDLALEVFAQAQDRLPSGTKIQILEDGATFIKSTISNLQRTVMIGGGLVALVVFVFLRRMGPTLIVAFSIPASMIVTFLVVYGMGYTLNSVTLIAMSLSVGMVVDNGVVALENISRKLDDGLEPLKAAYEGASEVGGALLASTTTSLVIFAPMIFISGIVGQMFAQLAVVMIVTVSASLFVALTLTPTMSARLLRPSDNKGAEHVAWWEHRYVSILKKSVYNPWKTILGSCFIAVLTMVSLMFLSSDFLPKDDIGQLSFSIELPVSATKEESLRVGKVYADALRSQPEVEAVALVVGTSNSGMGEKEGNNIAQVRSRLTSPRLRDRSDQEIGDAILAMVERPVDVVSVEMSRDGAGAGALGATKPIIVEVLGNDLVVLQKAVRIIELGMKEIPGTKNVVAELLQEKPEVQVRLNQSLAKKQGILVAMVGQELRLAMSGSVVSRYTGGDRPRDIVLRFQEEDRSSISSWRRVPVRGSQGSLQTLGQIAEQGEAGSPIQIRRKDKARILHVSTELDQRALTAVALDVESMLEQLDLGDGVRTQIGGAIRDQRESFGDLNLLMMMGLALVYLVMVAQFESWTDPFIIMFSVPFAATGAFLALLLTGTNLSVTSFLGLIILIGVVVNNAIVLIDYIKLQRSRGMELYSAIFFAGQRRLRPVLITSLTTAGGMLPLALTQGEGEQLWGPMGKTALGGLLVSSVVTLVLVPALYVLIEGYKEKDLNIFKKILQSIR